jgi:mannose-1-phosphate guanylyltransferase/mannose-6-phosphate isomerase
MSALPLIPVILCGGSGTRLWPLSRESYPKQFLRLHGDSSLLQQTLRRCNHPGTRPPLLLTHEDARFLVAEQLRETGIDDALMILEPHRRGTAPAIISAALYLQSQEKDALMLILPSDHLIEDSDAFVDAVSAAAEAAAEGLLMTFGIQPHSPETGYGYLHAGDAFSQHVRRLAGFVEKPDLPTAQDYVSSGRYFWNSGMFLFRCSQLISEAALHAPAVLQACEHAVEAMRKDADFLRLGERAYSECPDIAIDYALMEPTRNAGMVTLDAGWSDIGSWSSVWEINEHDAQGNSVRGDALIEDCDDCLVHSDTRLIAAIGMKDAIIIDTPDALLVMDRAHSQDTRKVVRKLLTRERSEATWHKQVKRPWGSYDAIGQGTRFQVKRITVHPGARLSLQMHHHRAEHWIVVSGTARVIDGEKDYLLTENQSTFIGVGVIHSLENPGKIPLELIEVQSGSYLGEDDIVRLSDAYGRA